MLIAIILADMTMIMNLTETTDNVTTEVRETVILIDDESTEIIEYIEMIDEMRKMIESTTTTEVLDEPRGMLNDDERTETGITKIVMILGQDLVTTITVIIIDKTEITHRDGLIAMIILDELTEIKTGELITPNIDDETTEIKRKNVIPVNVTMTGEETIETPMLTGGERIVVTMLKDAIGMMIAQILGTTTRELAKDGTGMMIAQILGTTTGELTETDRRGMTMMIMMSDET